MLSSAPGAVIPSFSAQLTFTVDRFFEAFVFDCFLGVVLGLDFAFAFAVVLGLDFVVVLGLDFVLLTGQVFLEALADFSF